jgi:hypothetical protein
LAQAEELMLKQLDLPPEQLAALTHEQRSYLDLMRRARSGKLSSEERKKIHCVHEAGHAVAELKHGVGRMVEVSIKPNHIVEGYCWVKIPPEKLSPLTEDTIKRVTLCSLAGPVAEMYAAGIGEGTGDAWNLWNFGKEHGFSPEQVNEWDRWCCRQERDDDPVPGVSFFVLDNFEKIFHVAYVLYERQTLTGEEVRSLLWKN